MAKPDVVAEHAALLKEQAELRKLCLDEWPIMSSQVAKGRHQKLLDIAERLSVIERTNAWKRRGD